jgi:hypothetical protein
MARMSKTVEANTTNLQLCYSFPLTVLAKCLSSMLFFEGNQQPWTLSSYTRREGYLRGIVEQRKGRSSLC